MDLSVDEFIEGLLSKEAHNTPPYNDKSEELVEYPKWYDGKEFNNSWKSLSTVRERHVRAGLAASTKGLGIVSQRDIALTLFAFISFAVLKPDKFGVKQRKAGEWEAYVHFWRTIGHMLGLEDRYNICRKTFEETHEVCQILLERVFTPCLENVPEYFEHTVRVTLDGLWAVNPSLDPEGTLYWCKYLAEVPGYVYTEDERILFQKKMMEHLKGKDPNTGVDSSVFTTAKPAIELPRANHQRILYLRDYDTIDSIPEYKRISSRGKNKLAFNVFSVAIYKTYLGRLYLNFIFLFSLLLMKYFPFLAFFRYGVKNSFTNMFEEDPKDDDQPKPNSEFYKEKVPEPWYKEWLSMLW